jgi:predicted TIM-barrel fold metal-dependent hydrolase
MTDPITSGIIDVHHHLCSAVYIDAVSDQAGLIPFQVRMLRNSTSVKSLEDMDKGGVAKSIVSLTTPGVWFGDDAQARRLARACNEHFAGLVADHPGRYGMFAAIPLPDIDGALREIEYALDTLKAEGIGFYTSYQNRHIGDPYFAPVLEELDRRGAIAYFHPCRPDCCNGLLPRLSEAAIEYPFDTTRTIASLVFSGSATRFVNIRFLFSHGGGTLPFLIHRFEAWASTPDFAPRLPNGILPTLRSFFYDTVMVAGPGPMAALRRLVPISQLLFGTDFPYGTAAEQIAGLGRCGLAPNDVRAIRYQNAERMLAERRG